MIVVLRAQTNAADESILLEGQEGWRATEGAAASGGAFGAPAFGATFLPEKVARLILK